jgi:hypothetical protein
MRTERPRPDHTDVLSLVTLAAAILLSSLWCATAARRLGVTYDEPTYVAHGLDRWRSGAIGGLMELGVMPLPVDVVTLPVHAWERWRGRPFDVTLEIDRVADGTDFLRVLPTARTSTLLFWTILLVTGWNIARYEAGVWAGAAAAVFMAAEPSLLAHASLATTDVAFTALVVAFGWALSRGQSRRWWRRVGVPGAVCGLALLSKASAVVFIPAVMVAVALASRPKPSPEARTALAWRDAGQIAAIGMAAAFLYCGTDGERSDALVSWATAQSGWWAGGLQFAADRLRIFSNAGEGLWVQLAHNARGHDAYLLGRSTDSAFWFYFPVLATIKLSVPVLAAPVLLAVTAPRALRNWPLVAAGLILAASTGFRVQTGVRFILPGLAFLIIGLAMAVGRVLSDARRPVRIAATGLVVAGLAWTAAESLRAGPDALTFTNARWGGTERGYLVVSDSNYDWGQGVPALREWQEREGVRALDVWYWGTDPAVRTGPWRVVTPGGVEAPYLAAGASLVYGGLPGPGQDQGAEAGRAAIALAARLRTRSPVDRAGPFLIYRRADYFIDSPTPP